MQPHLPFPFPAAAIGVVLCRDALYDRVDLQLLRIGRRRHRRGRVYHVGRVDHVGNVGHVGYVGRL